MPHTPTRAAWRTRIYGRGPSSSASTWSASTAIAEATRPPRGCSATSRTRCAPAQPARRRSSISRFRCARRGVLGLLAAGVVVLLPAAAPAAGRCGDRPWCDTTLSADARAGMLLAALTPDEKIGLLAGDDVTGVCACYAGSHTGTENGVARLGVPRVLVSDGPGGPRQGQATAMPIPMALAVPRSPPAPPHGPCPPLPPPTVRPAPRHHRSRPQTKAHRPHLRANRQHHAH